MNRIGHDNHIHAGFDRLADQSLQRNRFNRQLKAGLIGHHRGVSRHNHAELFTGDMTTAGVNPSHIAPRLGDAGHFGFLQNMHAHIGTSPGITPGDRVMARRAAARLP